MTVVVVHTTETPPGTAQAVARQLLERGAAPHQVYDPSDGTVVHCHDWDTPAQALKNLAGGVETNRRGGVIQVEIVGYAAEVPFQSGGWYTNLGRYLGRVCDLTGTPKVFPCEFIAGGYGLRAGQRLSNQAWLTVEGLIGHQHVPENTHWDPGGLDVERLIPHMQGDDMSAQDVQAITAHVDGLHSTEVKYLSEVEWRISQRITDARFATAGDVVAALANLDLDKIADALAHIPDLDLKALEDRILTEAGRRLGKP